MKRIIISYACGSKENRDAFWKVLTENEIGVKSSNEKGCLCYKYYFPALDDTSLLLIEQWENDEVLESHKQQPHFLLLAKIKNEMNIETIVL